MKLGLLSTLSLCAVLGLSYAATAEDTLKEQEKAELQTQKLITSIQGAYKKTFENQDVTGEKFQSEDTLEIVGISEHAIYLHTLLNFFNGHQCQLSGIAEYTPDGFIYQDTQTTAPSKQCKLTLIVKDNEITMMDAANKCLKFCGARGDFNGEVFTSAQKKPISDMKTLLDSKEYKTAVKHYQDTQK